MKKKEVIVVDLMDWIAVYVNDKKVYENHSVSAEQLVRICVEKNVNENMSLDFIDASTTKLAGDMAEYGRLAPDMFDDIVNSLNKFS